MLATLHQRHRGLTKRICAHYAEAASVCLSGHHASPPVGVEVVCDGSKDVRVLDWDRVDARTRAAWANQDDAVENGAYAVALAAVELELELVAIQRAETRTGADYYVAKADGDLEDAFRLEVAGSYTGDAPARRSSTRAPRARSRRSSRACRSPRTTPR